jgi:hypothetical protein
MMRIGEKWRCANPDCQAEITVASAGRREATAGPRCGCGWPMKRGYKKPVLRPLFRNENPFNGLPGAPAEPRTPQEVPMHLGERRRR